MRKPSNRDKLLTEGLRVVHERGFAGASVRDIVAAAGVPQGSFTNHFASKEAFGLEILNLYFQCSCELFDRTLRNESLPPLQRLSAYLDASTERLSGGGMRHGCLFGNFMAEASEHSELLRARVVELVAEVEALVGSCLRAAVRAGDLPRDFDSEGAAAFVVASLQGAILVAKAQRSPRPVERLKQILFEKVLSQASTPTGMT